MAAVRLVPLAPFPAVGLVAGAIRMKPSLPVRYLSRHLPGVLVATVFADQFAAASEDSAIPAGVVVGTIAARRSRSAAIPRGAGHGVEVDASRRLQKIALASAAPAT